MKTKNIILKLRTERGMSQDELADKIMVTRQAVSRWENGDTVPNTDTLKLLSKEFDVSINTLLGEPRKLFCQCCGMPIDDASILGRDKDGTLNEEYCKWCYADGTYTYNDMDELIDVCVKNMVNESFTEEQARTYLKEMLPKLDYWKRSEYRKVENLVRDSFWNVYRPGCLEHYVLNQLRNDPAFVPELDFVMYQDGELIGQNIFVRTAITADDGRSIPIMTMGPICIKNEYKRKGYGKILLDYSLEKAAELGCGALCFEGNSEAK